MLNTIFYKTPWGFASQAERCAEKKGVRVSLLLLEPKSRSPEKYTRRTRAFCSPGPWNSWVRARAKFNSLSLVHAGLISSHVMHETQDDILPATSEETPFMCCFPRHRSGVCVGWKTCRPPLFVCKNDNFRAPLHEMGGTRRRKFSHASIITNASTPLSHSKISLGVYLWEICMTKRWKLCRRLSWDGLIENRTRWGERRAWCFGAARHLQCWDKRLICNYWCGWRKIRLAAEKGKFSNSRRNEI